MEWTYGTSGGSTGQITQETKKLTASENRVTTFAYDAKGQMTSRTVDPSGLAIVSRWAYDAKGNVTAAWSLNTASTDSADATSATYDTGDRLASIRMPQIGGVRGGADYAYDSKGQLVSLQVLKPGGGYATSAIAYSATGRPTSVTDPSNHATTFEYDSEDRLFKVTDADGKNTAYEYWPDNKVERIKKAVGTSLEQTYARIWYDFAGRKLAQRPARGNALNSGQGGTAYDTNYGFDEYSRPSVTYFPDATEERVVYNPNGTVQTKRTRNVANPTGGDHNDIKFEYDASQRLVRQYEYWTNRSPLVRNDKKTAYDYAGRVVCQWMVGSSGACDGTSPARIEYMYDKADRLTHEIQDGRDVAYGYDAAGNRTGIAWPDGKAAAYQYDARGQLSSVSFESVSLAAYSYDIEGRAAGASFGNGNTASVSHEADGDLSLLAYALKDESGAAQALTWTYTYTGAHRLLSQSVSVAAHDWSPPANVTTTYTAPSMAPGLPDEAANKVDQYEQIAESVNSGSPANSTLSYDVRGNLTSDTDQSRPPSSARQTNSSNAQNNAAWSSYFIINPICVAIY